jgi:hypothetical protein
MQPRALKRLGLIEEDTNYCHQDTLPMCAESAPDRHIGCNRDKYVTYIWNTPVARIIDGLPEYLCFLNGTAVDYWGAIVSDTLLDPITITSFDAPVIDAFLTLRYLQAANIYVQSSESEASKVPLQLSALTEMKHLAIRYMCMAGTLPTAWQWPQLSTLLVGVVGDGPEYEQTPVSADCGIHGPLPAAWPRQMPQLKELCLVNNRLEGRLPRSLANWKELKGLWLSQNRFSGSIPAALAGLRTTQLVLKLNGLTGGLPSFGDTSRPSPLQKSLEALDLAGNALTGKSVQGCDHVTWH